MRPHTKFSANGSTFREFMTFHILSRWLPSAILNFEKFKFWINFRGWRRNLRQHTKFGQNRMIGGRNIAIKMEIQYGRRSHVEFTSGLHFDTLSRLGIQNASAYQISSQSVNILRSYDGLYIFKMASVRYLEF